MVPSVGSTAVVASATAVEGTALEGLAMAAAVEAGEARVGCKKGVGERAPEATERAGAAEGWMVQEHVEEGWAMMMGGGAATVVSVMVAETVREA